MTEALRALLAGAIDYAGLFPPAGLDMPEAARNYANYRSGPHAWALGRFIVPSARLNEVDPDWKCVVLGVPPRAVEVCEMKVEHAGDAVPLLAILPESVTAYFELHIGLHHPLRSVQRCTYQPDSPTALMHGFVNVFLAAALLWHGGSESAAVATLEEQSPGAFHFDDRSAAWHGHRLATAQIREARERFAISFGSCSFEEPISDLHQLGWL